MAISTDSPASRTINRFGGITRCAKALAKPKSTVQRWKDSGFIHPDHYPAILAAAVAKGIVLDVHDLNVVDVDHPAFGPAASASSDFKARHEPATSPPTPEGVA